MWRSFFLALGIFACVLGLECLVIEKAVLRAKSPAQATNTILGNTPPAKKEVNPPEWAPWSLLSTGAVVILYSLTLTKGGDH